MAERSREYLVTLVGGDGQWRTELFGSVTEHPSTLKCRQPLDDSMRGAWRKTRTLSVSYPWRVVVDYVERIPAA